MARSLRLLNPRLLVLVAVIAAPALWFSHMVLSDVVTGGVVRHEGWTDVNLQRLGFFTFDPATGTVDQVPARFRALDKQRVVLKGFMYNPNQAGDDVRDFQFVFNVRQCCFGTAPKVQERVFARCPKGQSVPYDSRTLMKLTGTLHVNLEREPETDVITAVYTLDVEDVRKG